MIRICSFAAGNEKLQTSGYLQNRDQLLISTTPIALGNVCDPEPCMFLISVLAFRLNEYNGGTSKALGVVLLLDMNRKAG